VERQALRAAVRLEWSQAGRSLPGQELIGDAAWVQASDGRARVAVMDGLGHGREASLASGMALEMLPSLAGQSLEAAFDALNRVLTRSRGAALSMADLDLDAMRLRWAGVGNVEGVLLRARDPERSRERLLLQSGIVGCRMPHLHPRELALENGDRLLFYTDGLDAGLVQGLDWRQDPRDSAARLLQTFAKPTDDALVWLGRLHG
jgi:serine phosphatase RsbU (regulator of sigma subunit)